MISALPLCRTHYGLDDSWAGSVRSTGAFRLCVCLHFYPSIRPATPLPSQHPSSPGVHVSLPFPFCHSMPCHYSHWLSKDGRVRETEKCLCACKCVSVECVRAYSASYYIVISSEAANSREQITLRHLDNWGTLHVGQLGLYWID